MQLKKIVAGVIILAVLAGGAYAYKGSRDRSEGENGQDVLPPVKAEHKVIVEGIVVPAQSADLSFSTGGAVAGVEVAEGGLVEQGQVLVRLDNRDIKARLQQAQAELARARANLDSTRTGRQAALTQARADFDIAELTYKRISQLHEHQAAAQEELDQARAAYLKAEAGLQLAQSQLEQVSSDGQGLAAAEISLAAAAVEQAESALAHTQLRAPFSGTVASIDIKAGEFASPGTPVVRLADFSRWQIKTDDLTELNVAEIKEGGPAVLTFDAIPNLELPGKIVHIQAFGERKRGDITYTVTIEPEQHDDRLRWNMTATVVIRP